MNLRTLETHFEFGANWQSYLNLVDDKSVQDATAALESLVGGRIDGKSFIDIGSGSGLYSLGALRLGAKSLFATDIDPKSTQATTDLLTSSDFTDWRAQRKSVFDLNPSVDGRFDIVYSWGVLHHTGDMWEAIRNAASLVNDNGQFIIGIYRKTALCTFWKWEKYVYTKSPIFRPIARAGFKAAFAIASLAAGRGLPKAGDPRAARRGMDWSHNVHDWLGGFPYESASPEKIAAFVAPLGFQLQRKFVHPGTIASRLGIFGSGIDEFVFQRVAK